MEVEAKGETRVQLIYLASRISSRMLVSESERDKDKDKKRTNKRERERKRDEEIKRDKDAANEEIYRQIERGRKRD